MKRIEKMTKKAVEMFVEENNIAVTLRIGRNDTEAVKEPGTVGICNTKNGNLMVYMVNEKGKLYNTSVHTNRRIANGRVLERLAAVCM